MVNTEQKTEGPGQRPGVPCTFVILLDDSSIVNMVKKQNKVESCSRVAEVARTAFNEKFGLDCEF